MATTLMAVPLTNYYMSDGQMHLVGPLDDDPVPRNRTKKKTKYVKAIEFMLTLITLMFILLSLGTDKQYTDGIVVIIFICVVQGAVIIYPLFLLVFKINYQQNKHALMITHLCICVLSFGTGVVLFSTWFSGGVRLKERKINSTTIEIQYDGENIPGNLRLASGLFSFTNAVVYFLDTIYLYYQFNHYSLLPNG